MIQVNINVISLPPSCTNSHAIACLRFPRSLLLSLSLSIRSIQSIPKFQEINISPISQIPKKYTLPLSRGRQKERKGRKENGEYILSKSPSQRPLTANLLTTHKAVHRDRDRTVNILRRAVFRKPHFGKGFADAHNCFEMADLKKKNQTQKHKYIYMLERKFGGEWGVLTLKNGI